MKNRRSLLGLAVFWIAFTTVCVLGASGSPSDPKYWALGLLAGLAGFVVAWFFFLRVPRSEKGGVDSTLVQVGLERSPGEEAEPIEETPPSSEEPDQVRSLASVGSVPASGCTPSGQNADAEGALLALQDFLAASRNLLSRSEKPDRFVELKTNADFIRENVQRAYEISDNLAGTAQQAFHLSEQVQNGVKIVTDALSESIRQSEILFEQSKKIVKILEMMSEVSEKIHVLSINASIVSARAGVLGKGFDVVAKEIRALAKETEHSLKNIEEVIRDLQRTINDVIRVVKNADSETEQERSSLVTVAGSLQGVILGVEIIRAVSAVVKEKAEEETNLVQKLVEEASNSLSSVLESHVTDWEGRLAALTAPHSGLEE